MNLNQHSRKSLILAIVVSLFVLFLGFGTEFALAGTEVRQVPQETVQNGTTGWGEEGIKEVGVEWINDFPGTDGDRSHWDESCDGLYNQLLADGWTSSFRFTDWAAYEDDFKNESLSGHEDYYVDKADIAMVCTHGSSTYDDFWDLDLSSVYFGSTEDDHHLSPGDAYKGYGDQDLEWLAFDSCSVLSDGGAAPYYNRGYWAATMDGLHLLLGFKNTMYVSAPGDGQQWAHYMNGEKFWLWWIHSPRTVTQAWFEAVDDVQPSVTCARVLAGNVDNFNDYLHGKGYVSADPPDDGSYNWWDHCSSGGKSAVNATTKQPELAVMPRMFVSERLVDKQFVLDNIAPAFGFEGGLGDVYEDDMYFYMLKMNSVYTETLQVDKASGGFNYRNLSRLWVPPDMPLDLPNDAEAYGFMEDWFKNAGARLPGVMNRSYNWSYEIEEIHEMELLPDGNGGLQEVEVATTPANGVLTYPRIISGKTLTPDGLEPIPYPVFGAGARLKIYFGGIGEIIGMRGGMRDVTPGAMVAVMDATQAWQKFLADRRLAIPEVDFLGDSLVFTGTPRLGYYEMPYMVPQGELIPVWEFMVNSSKDGKLLEENIPVYVPAVEGMPPTATIVSPLEGAILSAHEPISFAGEISGGTGPYVIDWTSSVDGFLSSEKVFSGYLSNGGHPNELTTNQVQFTVTDANGMSATDTVTLNIKPIFWLPFLVR